MRLIIAGSREFKSLRAIQQAVKRFREAHPDFVITEVVTGGCRGADRLAEEYTRDNLGLPVKTFPPDWKTHGKAAGPIRNAEMAQYGDALLALFIAGVEGRGTSDMVNKMQQAGKTVVTEILSPVVALSEF